MKKVNEKAYAVRARIYGEVTETWKKVKNVNSVL